MKSKSFTQTLCTLYLAVLFIVYPLFQHDHYYNMGDNKYYFYLISTVIFLILLAISVLTDPARYYKSKKKNKNSKGKNKTTPVVNEKLTFKQKVLQLKDKFMAWFGPKSIVEKFVWAYLLCAIISFIFGIDHYYGFWGAPGWNMGLLVQCLMIACFFVYAKVWEPDMKPFYFSMIGSSVVMFLGIIMRFGIDPLGNYEGLGQNYINKFISTIGQTSWYSGYIITVIPIGISLFFIGESTKVRRLSLIYTVLACLAMAIADSDSILLGISGMLMVLFWVAFNDEKYMSRFFEITTILAGAFVVMEFSKKALSDYYNSETDWSTIKALDIKMYLIAFIISFITAVVIYILRLNKIKFISRSHNMILRNFRASIYVIVALSVLSIVIYIVLNTKGFFDIKPDTAAWWNSSIWIFNPYWGNTRGVSWKVCWDIFTNYNVGRKLVGIGPDSLECLTQSIEEYRSMIERIHGEGQVLSCAHNEFYNHLVIYGIAGGSTYLGMYISGILENIKAFEKKPEVIVGAVCIASYIGHNIFCYQTVLCTPFLLVVMGICETIKKNNMVIK